VGPGAVCVLVCVCVCDRADRDRGLLLFVHWQGPNFCVLEGIAEPDTATGKGRNGKVALTHDSAVPTGFRYFECVVGKLSPALKTMGGLAALSVREHPFLFRAFLRFCDGHTRGEEYVRLLPANTKLVVEAVRGAGGIASLC